ncbi:DUF5694 domain-containing protein [Gorillibacterium timonense]|uniref:DUF5694 domain-containing protein n=1 Tax=Gorillibacterium timonense TaxID=1689269 RepID=UPI00071D905D|nr:DUF5694 domain-containing protein [Gorillibacterium timonense]
MGGIESSVQPIQPKLPKLLLLGTFHMGSTTDLFSARTEFVLSAQRRQEIAEVVERLRRFHPTKVALELVTKQNDTVNEQYRQYRKGSFELPVNEAYQLGFRIAADLVHEQVYCIDWMEKGAGTKSAGEVYEWAKEHQPALWDEIYGWLFHSGDQPAAPSYRSILEMYRDCNEPTGVKKHHTMNLNMARIGDGDQYVGVEWLIWWYQRNLILFSNLARLADSSDDRILLIIGSAHVELLSRFIEESGRFELDSAWNYLE